MAETSIWNPFISCPMSIASLVNKLQVPRILQIVTGNCAAITLLIPIVLLSPVDAIAKRTVKGTITDKNGNPAANVRVKAFDDDWPDADDLMAPPVMTNVAGYYEIHYEAKHYDNAPHGWTIWRPDIFIRVSAPVNGRCDDGEWKQEKNWIHLKDSRVTEDHPHRRDLTKNLKLTNFPMAPVFVHTFKRGVDMWSEVDFFFHANAFGCGPDGDKIEWEEWGMGGTPTSQQRCWYRPKAKCTESDYNKIRDIGLHPYPAEPERLPLRPSELEHNTDPMQPRRAIPSIP
jgi:hypothetical protein